MKKIVVIFVLAGLALLVLGVVALFYLGPIVRSGVERVGPQITKVPVKVESAQISVMNGSGELRGFVLSNPDGFKTPEAVKVGTIEVTLVPKSVMANKVVVRSVRIESPEITYEAGLGGSNLGKILESIQAVASQEKSAGTNISNKALQVDEFLITGGKINVSATVLGGKSVALPLPEIRLVNLGQGPEGITPAELSSKAFSAIVEAAAKAVAGNALNIGKTAGDAVKGIATEAQDRAKKLGSGVSDLFKSKNE